ncbi:unnamed protein product [Orchesella dallaii]|uniref:Uncharacterized protein n=1 Tax=Orchesella dallaii TaxID=48710 RepID=A0ABP1S0H6_9HEXA
MEKSSPMKPIIVSIFVMFLGYFTITDVSGEIETDIMADVYPDVRRCYKNFPRDDESTARNALDGIIQNCKEKYPEPNSFCYKICMMTDQSIISYRDYVYSAGKKLTAKSIYYAYLIETSKYPFGQEMLGINEDQGNKVTNRLMKRYKKCEKYGPIKTQPGEPGDCELLSEETVEKLRKLQNCVEKALTCSDEMDDIDPNDVGTEAENLDDTEAIAEVTDDTK